MNTVNIKKSWEIESVALRDAFVESMREIARKDEKVVLMDADLMGALGSKPFAEEFPDRNINCGIAEANMIGVAAGLSATGYIPFAHTFACFATRRVYDQIFISGCFAQSNIKILGSDPGVTAAYNGGTHMPFEDIALMRPVPGMTIIEFSDTAMVKSLLPKIAAKKGMVYMRMARKLSYGIYEDGQDFTVGKAMKIRDGKDAAIIACGYDVREALVAAQTLASEGIEVSVYDMFTIKPLDIEAVVDAAKTGAVVTAENHNINGGLGGAVAEALAENAPCIMERVGVNDQFGEVGPPDFLAEKFGIDASAIVKKVKSAIARKG